jgi:hypothetical protein
LSRRGTVPALKDILEAVERIQRYIGPMEPERLGLLAAIGIEKGKPFAPDAPDEEDPHRSGGGGQSNGTIVHWPNCIRRNISRCSATGASITTA